MSRLQRVAFITYFISDRVVFRQHYNGMPLRGTRRLKPATYAARAFAVECSRDYPGPWEARRDRVLEGGVRRGCGVPGRNCAAPGSAMGGSPSIRTHCRRDRVVCCAVLRPSDLSSAGCDCSCDWNPGFE